MQLKLEKLKKKKILKLVMKYLNNYHPVDFGRIAAQTARQVITQSVRAAEKERQYNDFIGKKDEILSGIVKAIRIRQCNCGSK